MSLTEMERRSILHDTPHFPMIPLAIVVVCDAVVCGVVVAVVVVAVVVVTIVVAVVTIHDSISGADSVVAIVCAVGPVVSSTAANH